MVAVTGDGTNDAPALHEVLHYLFSDFSFCFILKESLTLLTFTFAFRQILGLQWAYREQK